MSGGSLTTGIVMDLKEHFKNSLSTHRRLQLLEAGVMLKEVLDEARKHLISCSHHIHRQKICVELSDVSETMLPGEKVCVLVPLSTMYSILKSCLQTARLYIPVCQRRTGESLKSALRQAR